jgi:protein-disulfide isomerase
MLNDGTSSAHPASRLAFGLVALLALVALAAQLWLERRLALGPTVVEKVAWAPFAVAAAVSLAAGIWPRPRVLRVAAWTALVALLGEATLSAWQVAMEHHWIASVCSGPANSRELQAALGGPRGPRCDTPGWSFLRFSIAAVTGLAAMALAALCLVLPLGWRGAGSTVTGPTAAPPLREVFALLLVMALVPAVLVARLDASAAVGLPPITANDHVMGAAGAPIVLVEYVSMTCPHCAAWSAAVMPQFVKAWVDTGRVRYVLRDFPLDHAGLSAAMLAHCAPAARYFDVVAAMLADQADWVKAADPVPRLTALAGLDAETARRCLADDKLETAVLTSRVLAQQGGIIGVPAVVIDGARVPAVPQFSFLDDRLRHELEHR